MNPDKNEQLFENFYVARQPIFDNSGAIWGYELLYRNGQNQQVASITNQDLATLSVATCGFALSQDYSDQTKKICINFTENLILQGAPNGLPPTVTVIEVLEDIKPTKKLNDKLLELKQAGYLIAIDDYVGGCDQKKLLSIADIVKVDILSKTTQEIDEIFLSLEGNKALKLAEKVDKRETLEYLRPLGCNLYQGYFFAKPINLHGRRLKSIEISKLRILKDLEAPELNEDSINKIIMSDPGITYRLLRMLNSAAFGFSVKITSVIHAIRMIGIFRVKYWLRMVVLSDIMRKNITSELYIMALNRGRLLEELAQIDRKKSFNPDTMFLFGMLSLLDVMLEIPMNEIIDQVPLQDEFKSGYFDPQSIFGKYLQLVIAIENADSVLINKLCQDIGVGQRYVALASNRSTAWTNEMYNNLPKKNNKD